MNLLKDYSRHCFVAKWQCDQLDNLLEQLPLDHTVAIHEYSEWYTAGPKMRKSEYFDVARFSLHVTILYHHATERNDGIKSTEENLEVVKEHMLIILMMLFKITIQCTKCKNFSTHTSQRILADKSQ